MKTIRFFIEDSFGFKYGTYEGFESHEAALKFLGASTTSLPSQRYMITALIFQE